MPYISIYIYVWLNINIPDNEFSHNYYPSHLQMAQFAQFPQILQFPLISHFPPISSNSPKLSICHSFPRIVTSCNRCIDFEFSPHNLCQNIPNSLVVLIIVNTLKIGTIEKYIINFFFILNIQVFHYIAIQGSAIYLGFSETGHFFILSLCHGQFIKIDKYQQMNDQSNLSIPKIKNLIKLEELFHNRFLTIELVHELISLYTCCIEAIDQKEQELRVYFLDKIQFVLSRPEVQALLSVVVNANQGLVDQLRQTFRRMQGEEEGFNNVGIFDRKRLNNYDGDNPDDKKKKIDLQLQLMNEVEENRKQLTSKLQSADLKLQEEATKIKSITNEQNNRLEQRLANRKKRARKSSVDQTDQVQQPKVDKKQLLEAQAQINDAVIRITVRATQRTNMSMVKKGEKQARGRVKVIKRMDEDEDQ